MKKLAMARNNGEPICYSVGLLVELPVKPEKKKRLEHDGKD
jgi:hypothetical protein